VPHLGTGIGIEWRVRVVRGRFEGNKILGFGGPGLKIHVPTEHSCPAPALEGEGARPFFNFGEMHGKHPETTRGINRECAYFSYKHAYFRKRKELLYGSRFD
jgi:hypothetical protein